MKERNNFNSQLIEKPNDIPVGGGVDGGGEIGDEFRRQLEFIKALPDEPIFVEGSGTYEGINDARLKYIFERIERLEEMIKAGHGGDMTKDTLDALWKEAEDLIGE